MHTDTQQLDNNKPFFESFIETHIDSFVKWEIIHFFMKNRHTADTATYIANALNRNVRTVKPALMELSEAGFVERFDFDDLTIYTLSEDDTVQNDLETFVEECTDRITYIQAIYFILRRIR